MSAAAKILLVHVSGPSSPAGPSYARYNPLALGYLKTYSDSVLKGAVSSEIVEFAMEPCVKDPRAVAAAILEKKPEIVGFSCYIWNVGAVIAVSRALKKGPGAAVRVVLGGPDAAGRGARILAESGADILVLGEGELTFADLLRRHLAGGPWPGTPGTVALARGKTVTGPPRERITDLDIIPSPYLAGLFDAKKHRNMLLETSRGCPFKCAFCTWTVRGGVRFFSLKRALADASWIMSQAPVLKDSANTEPHQIFVADHDITMHEKRGRKLFDKLRLLSSKHHIQWAINCNIMNMTPAMARTMNSEQFELDLGIESINDDALRGANRKPVSREELGKRLAVVSKFAPKAKLLFQVMMGMPGDTREGFIRTLRWAVAACVSLQPSPVLGCFPLDPSRRAPDGRKGAPPRREDILRDLIARGELATQPRAEVQLFHTQILPGCQYEHEAAGLGIDWDPKPPYQIRSTRTFSAADFASCYETIYLLADFTRLVYGHPIVRIYPQNT